MRPMSNSGIGLFFCLYRCSKNRGECDKSLHIFCCKKNKSEELGLNVRIGAKNRPIKLKTNRVLSPVVRGISLNNTIPISVKR